MHGEVGIPTFGTLSGGRGGMGCFSWGCFFFFFLWKNLGKSVEIQVEILLRFDLVRKNKIKM
jgi:hypothetical protein